MKKNKIILVFIVFIFFCSCSRYRIQLCALEYSKIEPDVLIKINESFIFHTKSTINKEILKILNAKYNDFKIVNPGEDYNQTDIHSNLPNKQLLFGGKNENTLYFVFEEGGVAIQTKAIITAIYPSFKRMYVIGLPPIKGVDDFINKLKHKEYYIHSCEEFR